mmetsp:Transcript_8928/g.15715  ORF Transcript_8928/g.15715 Transcript_8928/m.15715 type:complete len:237 (-) Transcript_8928:680-1390(-)
MRIILRLIVLHSTVDGAHCGVESRCFVIVGDSFPLSELNSASHHRAVAACLEKGSVLCCTFALSQLEAFNVFAGNLYNRKAFGTSLGLSVVDTLFEDIRKLEVLCKGLELLLGVCNRTKLDPRDSELASFLCRSLIILCARQGTALKVFCLGSVEAEKPNVATVICAVHGLRVRRQEAHLKGDAACGVSLLEVKVPFAVKYLKLPVVAVLVREERGVPVLDSGNVGFRVESEVLHL